MTSTEPAAPATPAAWAPHYERAAAQLQRHGHLRRAGAGTRTWADRQIRALRAGAVPAELVPALEEIGISAGRLTTAETTLLVELDWWIQQHQSAEVPQAAVSRTIGGRPYRLGKRVAEVRDEHARGTLPDALAQELQQRTGWSWRVREDRWERMWQEKCRALGEHVEQHGSLEGLPQATYQWLIRQRAAFESMPPERRERLEAIPGALTARDTRVSDFVDAARAWLSTRPRGSARSMTLLRYSDTVTMPDGTVVPVGKRAGYYRRRHAGLEGTHPLTGAEVALIEALSGWSWQRAEEASAGGE